MTKHKTIKRLNSQIIELRKEIELKTNEARQLTENGRVEDSEKEITKIKSLKLKLNELEEMRDICYNGDYIENETWHGNEYNSPEMRKLTGYNITKIYPNDKNLSLGKYMRGALTGNWENASEEEKEYRSLSTTTGSVLIPSQLSSEILQKVINKSMLYSNGVPIVDMPNGNLTIAKIKKNPEYAFKGELEKVTPEDAVFEGITLKGKLVYGLMKVSIETMESAANLDAILSEAMSNSIADAIDKSMLYGAGDKEILGVFNNENINVIEATSLDYKPFINAVGAIRKNNGEPTIMGVNADVDTSLNLLFDTTGQPIKIPPVIENLNRTISNNLKNDKTNGSDAIVLDPKSLIIGQQVKLKFTISEDLGFEDGSIWLRVYALLDMAAVKPELITHIKKLK